MMFPECLLHQLHCATKQKETEDSDLAQVVGPV